MLQIRSFLFSDPAFVLAYRLVFVKIKRVNPRITGDFLTERSGCLLRAFNRFVVGSWQGARHLFGDPMLKLMNVDKNSR